MKDYVEEGSRAGSGSGFHLRTEERASSRDDRSVAGSSLYDKRRIDSMFEETRSLVSGYSPVARSDSLVANSVQARIEKMFREVGDREGWPVGYLGAVALDCKAVSSLAALQKPLERLYFDYAPAREPLAGRLRITDAGLRVSRPRGQTRTNPFHTIAVWAAVKCARRPAPGGGQEFAFVPLVSDPCGLDKSPLFRRLEAPREPTPPREDPPLFAVVMKRPDAARRLECHAFVCARPEDAVVMAADLYTALVRAVPRAEGFGRRDGVHGLSPPETPRPRIEIEKKPEDVGDVLTKVAIPRSKSFLKTGGPFSSRYTAGLRVGPDRRKSSPLGLNELFQELRHQEGLYNIDDILNAIIDSEGMSFNDLKPIYKEFVLRLALTLTKDELYQRSKSIMQKQKSKRQRIKRRNSCKLKRTFAGGGAGFRKALKKSVDNLKGSKRGSSFEFASVLFPSCGNKRRVFERRESEKRENSSESSGGRRERRKPEERREPNRSSSGYFSCSECSYDSETCTRNSVEKCYCSLGKKKEEGCCCDTDSCLESEKCYCARPERPSVFEQLRRRGFAASESSESPSPEPTAPGLKSSRSLEFLQVERTSPSPECGCKDREQKRHESKTKTSRSYSSDNLALDYELFDPDEKEKSEGERERKVLVVSARDRVLCSGRPALALSVKKSAEIAALFGRPRPSEEVIYNTLEPPDYLKLKGGYANSDLENSLGYYP